MGQSPHSLPLYLSFGHIAGIHILLCPGVSPPTSHILLTYSLVYTERLDYLEYV